MPLFTVRFADTQETVDVRSADTAYDARDAVATEWDVDFNLLEVLDENGQVVESEDSLSPEGQAA